MAHVGERGQVLLMAALGMAILFVALALILNTAIYTENLATRGSEVAGTGDAVRFLDTTRSGIGGTIAYVNRHNDTSHDALQQNLSEAIPEWEDASSRQLVQRGRTVEVSLDGTTNGTRIAQDTERNFTDNGHDETWIVAEDVNGTRDFRINVTDSAELESLGDDHFEIAVEDGVNSWTLSVMNGSGDVQVRIENESNVFFCDTVAAPVWINVTAGTVGGVDCEGLSFAQGIETPYEISFDNADNVTGTFSLIVDNETLATSPEPHLFDGPVNGGPYAAPAIYSANVSVTYQTPRLFYDASVRVAPGETDD